MKMRAKPAAPMPTETALMALALHGKSSRYSLLPRQWSVSLRSRNFCSASAVGMIADAAAAAAAYGGSSCADRRTERTLSERLRIATTAGVTAFFACLLFGGAERERDLVYEAQPEAFASSIALMVGGWVRFALILRARNNRRTEDANANL